MLHAMVCSLWCSKQYCTMVVAGEWLRSLITSVCCQNSETDPCVCCAQDASGDSDLWDLAAAESGDAIQRHGSPSPFASRSLLGSFDMEVCQPATHSHSVKDRPLNRKGTSIGTFQSTQ